MSPDSSQIPGSAALHTEHAAAPPVSKEPDALSPILPPICQKRKVRLKGTRCENAAKTAGRPWLCAGGGLQGALQQGQRREEGKGGRASQQTSAPDARYRKFVSARHGEKQDVALGGCARKGQLPSETRANAVGASVGAPAAESARLLAV